MTDAKTASVEELAGAIRADPANAHEQISELVSRIEDDRENSRIAMFTLNNIATEYPSEVISHVDEISTLLYHSEVVATRSQCAEILSDIAKATPEAAADAKRGLTEATRLRTDKLEGPEGYDEVQTVRRGIEGWTSLAEYGHEVPAAVVENAIKVLEVAGKTTVSASIKLLEAAVRSGTPRRDAATRALYDLSKLDADDDFARRKATSSLARLYLDGRIEGHRGELRETFAENRDLDVDSVVEDAIERLDSV
jgi:hypothetical protein